ncbi:AChain A, Esterase Domain Of The Zfl2-1 Orf1 Protein From The Zebrafish Zfl2-1 Retrotransposon, partial [Clarias magur]
EGTLELHSADLEMEALEKQIRDLQVKLAQLRQRKAALESSRTDAHLSQVNSRHDTHPSTTSTPRVSLSRSNAPRTQPAQVSFSPAPGYHEAWIQQQRKTRAEPRARTSPPPPPPVFEIPTRNRFAPLRET